MSARALNSTVDEELLDLVDEVQPGASSNPQPDHGTRSLAYKHAVSRKQDVDMENEFEMAVAASGAGSALQPLGPTDPGPDSDAESSRGTRVARPGARAKGGPRRKRSATAGRSRSASVATSHASDVDASMDVDNELARAIGLEYERSGAATPLLDDDAASQDAEPGLNGDQYLEAPGTTAGPAKKNTKTRRKRSGRSVGEKLYCVCKRPYDEGHVMLACDRCDEWYHIACVDVDPEELDLIDQFVCPICQAADGSISTSYKRRCLRGEFILQLQAQQASGTRGMTPELDLHIDPEAEEYGLPPICNQPARLPLSKYCSLECGALHVRARLAVFGFRVNGEAQSENAQQWEVDLWNRVRAASMVDGVSVPLGSAALQEKARLADEAMVKSEENDAMVVDSATKELVPVAAETKRVSKQPLINHPRTGSAGSMQLDTLNVMLAKIDAERDTVQRSLHLVNARDRVIRRAAARSDARGTCGWDERLLLGDVEWEVFVSEGRAETDGGDESDEWFCTGKRKCDRHAGWQRLRAAEVEVELAVKNDLLDKLARREQEIRECIQELDPPVLELDVRELY